MKVTKYLHQLLVDRLDLVRIVVWYDGEHTFGDMGFMCMQLAEDIALSCGRIDGLPFGEVWMLAKTQPRLQNELRSRMDEVFGRGFYARLKRTDYDLDDIIARRNIY